MKLVRENLLDNISEEKLFDAILNESINESFNIAKLRDIISQLPDRKKTYMNLLKKFNKENNLSVKKYLGAAIIIIYITSFALKNNKWNDINRAKDLIEKSAEKLVEVSEEETEITSNTIKSILKLEDFSIWGLKTSMDKEMAFKNPLELSISDAAIDSIKHHEGLILSADTIGDGMITIGYGHAEPEDKSKYKIGDKISKQQAEILYKKDLKIKQRDVHRIFKQWQKEGLDVKLTQGMFDAIVSMTYNMGIGNMRRSNFIQLIKQQKYEEAADSIKQSHLEKKFPGLIKRRKTEYDIFTQDLS